MFFFFSFVLSGRAGVSCPASKRIENKNWTHGLSSFFFFCPLLPDMRREVGADTHTKTKKKKNGRPVSEDNTNDDSRTIFFCFLFFLPLNGGRVEIT